MINLFVEFGFQPLNMEALLDFELIERSSIINNFEARNITIIVTIFRKTKVLENMRIFVPEKVLIYTCVEMPKQTLLYFHVTGTSGSYHSCCFKYKKRHDLIMLFIANVLAERRLETDQAAGLIDRAEAREC